ncbi:MAG TPA: protein kinase [Polyangiaceae bacterium]|nr:protein kinase [Polyangiaceae bacterium]
MGMTVVCQACGARRTLPTSLYDSRVRGKMVNIPCKNCGLAILVDGTVPPPPGADPDAELPPPIPKQPSLPQVETPEEPEYAAPLLPPTREKTISHVDGPISERGPTARIGRYALFEQFATGGMATVHFGRLDGAGGFSRVVAIKRLLPHLVANREFTDMLLNEARLAARVRHPNVVATLDVVASKGDVLLVLDYVEGEALSTLCRAQAKEKREMVPIPIAIGIMQDVLHGLLAIHEATDEKGRPLDLVHRDISPPNVLVGVDGVARVLDFGIAKALQHLDESIAGRPMGKMGYMSPEQIHGERLTQRSDVFSAGIVLWELLCLRRMFGAEKPEERIDSILRGDYPRPRSLREDVPQEIDDAVMKALERSPDARFATIREFSAALESTPRASPREIGQWVTELAQEALAERTRMVAVLENWSEGPQIPLSSSPFASELPPPVAPPGSWPPPNNDATPISTALITNLNVNAQALARASAPPKPPARPANNLLWLALAVIAALIVGYLAHR